MKNALTTAIKAGFPLIAMQTVEVSRAVQSVVSVVDDWNQELKKTSATEKLKEHGYNVWTWTTTQGWVDAKTGKEAVKKTQELPMALAHLLDPNNLKTNPACVYVVQNAHLWWDDPMMKPMIFQQLIDFAKLRTPHQNVIFVGPHGSIPLEVAQLFMPIDYALPSRDELVDLTKKFDEVMGKHKLKDPERNRIADAGAGMTFFEFENALRAAIVDGKGKKIDPIIIQEEKAQAVKKSGFLEHEKVLFTLDDAGGLDNMKQWLEELSEIYHNWEKAQKYGLKTPKGCLITGISGTGKSLVAKVIANLFGVPLFRCDIGKVFGSLVGETEKNTMMLLAQIDAVSPCVILLDEIEKSLSGLESSGQSDSGVTARLIGRLLTYLQDKTSSSFFVATANDVSKLPPELLRKGRFNQIWFVDLPDDKERKAIFNIHLARTKRPLDRFNLDELVAATDGCTGAEIEGFIEDAMAKAFSEKAREFTTADIVQAAASAPFLSKTKAEDITALRRWAKGRARIANIDTSGGMHPAWWDSIGITVDKEAEPEAEKKEEAA